MSGIVGHRSVKATAIQRLGGGKAQIEYAASDVLHLHKLRDTLNQMLIREGRVELAQACFEFLPTRAQLDLAGWPETDIFAHA